MKKYQPNTKSVIVGLAFMIIGILCWVIKASFFQKSAIYLFPLGIVLICIGGLTLTITAFVSMRKNDLAMRAYLKKQEEKKQEKNQE